MRESTSESICRDCGQPIIFRMNCGRCVPMHVSGRACSGPPPYSKTSIKRAVRGYCSVCGDRVFFVRHNGGSVWLDDLGPPWPRHPCIPQDGEGPTRGISPSYDSRPVKPPSLYRESPPSLRCEYCPAKVRANNYRRHLRKVHNVVVADSPSPVPAVVLQESGLDAPAVLAQPFSANPILLTVYGANSMTVPFTAGDLSALPQLPAVDDSSFQDLRAVRLSDVLTKSLQPAGNPLSHCTASSYLVAESSTGLRVVFSWAEIDPAFTERRIFIVGNWASGEAGELRLHVPDDKALYRALTGVMALHLKESV